MLVPCQRNARVGQGLPSTVFCLQQDFSRLYGLGHDIYVGDSLFRKPVQPDLDPSVGTVTVIGFFATPLSVLDIYEVCIQKQRLLEGTQGFNHGGRGAHGGTCLFRLPVLYIPYPEEKTTQF